MESSDTSLEVLREKARVEERPFTSQTPLIGPLIVWVRSLWNSVATKWYVRPMLAQQNQFNRQVIDVLTEQSAQRDALAHALTAGDRDQTRLVRETAELTARVIQLNQRLQTLDHRLARLEAHDSDSPAA